MLTFADDLEIVEVIDGFLYSVKWPNQEFHSLDEMAVRLSDAEYLISFYRRHQERLGFFRVSEIEAVVRTQRESNEIL